MPRDEMNRPDAVHRAAFGVRTFDHVAAANVQHSRVALPHRSFHLGTRSVPKARLEIRVTSGANRKATRHVSSFALDAPERAPGTAPGSADSSVEREIVPAWSFHRSCDVDDGEYEAHGADDG